jgi:hypothetical protein
MPSHGLNSNAPSNNILVLPADLVAQSSDCAVLAAGLESENAKGLGNDHLLLLVVRGRDAFEDLEPLEGGGAAGGLVGDHATDGLVEDAGRGAEVEGAWDNCQHRGARDRRWRRRTHHRGSGCSGSSCAGKHGT